jgi:hypothetical protein
MAKGNSKKGKAKYKRPPRPQNATVAAAQAMFGLTLTAKTTTLTSTSARKTKERTMIEAPSVALAQAIAHRTLSETIHTPVRISATKTKAVDPETARLLSLATAANANSHLLSLPAELRNRIYCYVLISGNSEVELTKKDYYGKKRFLNTCTQIRKEAESIFHEENSFVMSLVVDKDFAGYVPALNKATEIVSSIAGDKETTAANIVLRFHRDRIWDEEGAETFDFDDLHIETEAIVSAACEYLPLAGAVLSNMRIESVERASGEPANDKMHEVAVSWFKSVCKHVEEGEEVPRLWEVGMFNGPVDKARVEEFDKLLAEGKYDEVIKELDEEL